MSRKCVVMVRWKKCDEWQAWSSLATFCSMHPRYPRQHIYTRCKDGLVRKVYSRHVSTCSK